MFSIVKYNFTFNSFSIFFNSTNLPLTNTTTFSVNQFTLNNQIYVSLENKNLANVANANTSIYILNSNGLVFNKTFTGLNVNSFTPFNYGLLLYSTFNNTYYRYFYSNDSYQGMYAPQLGTSSIVDAIYPFDNQSFIILYPGNFAILFMDSNATTFSTLSEYSFYQNSAISMQAFNIQGYKYYLLSGIDYANEFEILMQNIYYNPSDFVIPTSLTSATSITDTYNNSMPNTSYMSVSASDSNSGIAIFAIVIIILFIVGIIFIYEKNTSNRYYPPKNNSYLTRNQYNSQYSNESSIKFHNSFCQSCGASALPDDVFCQNCGSRL